MKIELETHEGMPPDRDTRMFLGFAADCTACLLKWSDRVDGGWMALTFGQPENAPRAYLPNQKGTPKITRYAELP